jgi:type III restriction enzyme
MMRGIDNEQALDPMSDQFFEQPILNSPYAYPAQHWELDEDGQPTNQILPRRRRAEFITPIPKPKKRRSGQDVQKELVLYGEDGVSTETQQYDPTPIINLIREKVALWRQLPNPGDWRVTAETARLLLHWRSHPFQAIRPFFCQVEAVETAVWLAEVAPKLGKVGQQFLDHIESANGEANPELMRVALKLATGAGKTTVMAMLIAWQTVNAVRHPQSKRFTRGFLIVTPGITIRDRLRVLQPNDPDSYYASRELVPSDMVGDIARAKIVITNYHSFKLRERMEVSKVGRSLLKGRGEDLQTLETAGQMLQRVMPELMGMKNVMVLNDEAHHCYREKPQNDALEDLKGDEKDEAKKNNEAARLWISGLETVKRKLGVDMVYDLSATPFFLRGSGYAEGTLFPWTVSDFSLMDAIECGIVKLPRVPVADNVPGGDMPKFRNLWEHIGKKMPKKGRGKTGQTLDPLSLPAELQTALEALYGHYEKTYDLWQQAGIRVPPVFIVVCNNTSTSKLVYDFISGFDRIQADGTVTPHAGRLALFRNYDEHGTRIARPRTLLIDSEQLESGEALDDNFRGMAADEIDRFRRDLVQRSGDMSAGQGITDQDLLREVMNTVGKSGKLGDSIRCVVSVSMLTEGWDVNSVTHILGIRAFGTQLLCEQVVGRALRRYSYELNEDGLFNVEYADILGIPFDFTAKPVVAPPKPPRETVQVKAMKPDRDSLEIRFPRVEGYRVELPEDRLTAKFTADSVLNLTPMLVGPSVTQNQGILGEAVELNMKHLGDMRQSTILFHLTKHLLYTRYRDPGEEPKLHLFGQLKRIVREWLDGGYLGCAGGTTPAQLIYQEIANMACDRIKTAIDESQVGDRPIKAILDAYNPTGSTTHVSFTTSKETRWQTDPRRCQINWVVCDSDWEAEFCRVAEAHSRVRSYVKNQGLGLEVPYLHGSVQRKYLPDFVVQIEDGRQDLLNLIVEIKGYRGEDAKEKASTMRTYWIPGVNNLGGFGRWAFAEFTKVFEIEAEFNEVVERLTQPN